MRLKLLLSWCKTLDNLQWYRQAVMCNFNYIIMIMNALNILGSANCKFFEGIIFEFWVLYFRYRAYKKFHTWQMKDFLSKEQFALASLAPAAASYVSSRQRWVEALPSGGFFQKRASAICDSLIILPDGHHANLRCTSHDSPSLLPDVHTLLWIVSVKEDTCLSNRKARRVCCYTFEHVVVLGEYTQVFRCQQRHVHSNARCRGLGQGNLISSDLKINFILSVDSTYCLGNNCVQFSLE
jgi:hypothetical protein